MSKLFITIVSEFQRNNEEIKSGAFVELVYRRVISKLASLLSQPRLTDLIAGCGLIETVILTTQLATRVI